MSSLGDVLIVEYSEATEALPAIRRAKGYMPLVLFLTSCDSDSSQNR